MSYLGSGILLQQPEKTKTLTVYQLPYVEISIDKIPVTKFWNAVLA